MTTVCSSFMTSLKVAAQVLCKTHQRSLWDAAAPVCDPPRARTTKKKNCTPMGSCDKGFSSIYHSSFSSSKVSYFPLNQYHPLILLIGLLIYGQQEASFYRWLSCEDILDAETCRHQCKPQKTTVRQDDISHEESLFSEAIFVLQGGPLYLFFFLSLCAFLLLSHI